MGGASYQFTASGTPPCYIQGVMRNGAYLRQLLDSFPGRRMLVVGDVILDRYWWGEASRLSPEAPVPVVRRRHATACPGGAANTAANLAALGATVQLLGVVGADREAGELSAVLAENGIETGGLVRDSSRPTSTKTRVVAMHQHVVRVDDESTEPVEGDAADAIAMAATSGIAGADAVVVSDYGKGLLAPPLLGAILSAAAGAGKRVLVDPKGADFARYRGAWLLKPNRMELGLLTRLPVRNHGETKDAGLRLAEALPGTLILVTEGPDGMTLFGDGAPIQVRHTPRQVYDVTGAGDTVLAAMAMAVAAGADCRQAMELASEAAALAVGQLGTAAVTREQLHDALA
jgi:D-glycero-beta-D-manno-heptose-7-phosphate kinase